MSCLAWACIVDLDGNIDEHGAGAMAARFPAAAFAPPVMNADAYAGFAAAQMLGATEEPSLISAEDGVLFVADAHFHAQSGGSLTGRDARELLRLGGRNAAHRLHGDFAVVYWDGETRELTGARDRFGVRPFFYAHHGRQIALSNSVHSLFAVPWVSHELRPDSVFSFVVDGVIHDPSATIYRDIFRLPPAHQLSFSNGGLQVERYWRVPAVNATKRLNETEARRTFADAFIRAVERAMGGSVGVSLSGGIDSTSIAAMAVRSCGSRNVIAFTAGNATKPDTDRDLARETATRLGVEWHLVDVEDAPLWGGKRTGWYALPVGSPVFPTFEKFASAASRTVPVMLAGDLGDELLRAPRNPWRGAFQRGGISGVLGELVAGARLGFPPRFGIRNRLVSSAPPHLVKTPGWLRAGDDHSVYSDSWLDEVRAAGVERERCWMELQSAEVLSALEVAHPVVTGTPVEYRFPFTGSDVVETALGLPAWPWFEDKALLRSIVQDVLPISVVSRTKEGVRDPVLSRLQAGDNAFPAFPVGTTDLLDEASLRREAIGAHKLPPERLWQCFRGIELLACIAYNEGIIP